MKPSNTRTLEEFVESGENIAITYSNLSLQEKIGEVNFPIYNVVNDYLEELIEAAMDVTLSDEEKNRYKYRPALLAYDLYGTTELGFVILLINGICNFKEFNLNSPTVKILKKDTMINYIKMIYNAEKNNIAEYNDNAE